MIYIRFGILVCGMAVLVALQRGLSTTEGYTGGLFTPTSFAPLITLLGVLLLSFGRSRRVRGLGGAAYCLALVSLGVVFVGSQLWVAQADWTYNYPSSTLDWVEWSAYMAAGIRTWFFVLAALVFAEIVSFAIKKRRSATGSEEVAG